MTNIGNTPEVSGSAEQGMLHCRALQDLFIKAIPSRTGDVPDSPNIQKQAQRLRQNEMTEEFDPNERTGQGHGQRSK